VANDYFMMRAEGAIPCSYENHKRLMDALQDYGALEIYREGDGIYIYSEGDCCFDFFDTDEDRDKVMDIIGEIITEAKLPYLTFCFASYCDKPRPSSCGGGEFRVMPNGGIVFPKMVWEEPA